MFNLPKITNPINLPTETDPFDSPEELSKSPDSSERQPQPPSTSHFLNSQTKLLASSSSQSKLNQSSSQAQLLQSQSILPNIQLPEHVKFPQNVRESAKTLYRKHSKKLPKSVRIYRSRDNDENNNNHNNNSNNNNQLQTVTTSGAASSSSKKQRSKESSHMRLVANEQHVEDITLEWLYKPYSISALVFIMIGLVCFGVLRDSEKYEMADNILVGFQASCFLFIVIGLLAFPNGPFIRPHPAMWRVVLSMSVIYLIILTWILFLSLDQVLSIMHYIDPSLRHMKREIDMVEEYAQDCWNISPQKIISSLDIFAFAHFSGWAGKACLLRSYGLCWLISILWEATELVFAHVLPNFQECWWDSWILDVCLCNGFGIFVGIQAAKYLEMRRYRWESVKTISGVSGKLQRCALQFTPHSWWSVRWIDPRSSPNRVFKLWIITILFLLCELNTFFFKHFFVFNSHHILCWGRHLFMLLVGAPSIRQFYVYATDMTSKRLGTQCWVFITLTLMETIVNVKFGWQTLSQTNILYLSCWAVFVVIACALSLWFMAAWSELQQFLETDKTKLSGEESFSHEQTTDHDLSHSSKPSSHRGVRTGNQNDSECDESDCEDASGIDSTKPFFNWQNRWNDGYTDTTDTDNEKSYFPAASRLRRRLVKRFEEFRK